MAVLNLKGAVTCIIYVAVVKDLHQHVDVLWTGRQGLENDVDSRLQAVINAALFVGC